MIDKLSQQASSANDTLTFETQTFDSRHTHADQNDVALFNSALNSNNIAPAQNNPFTSPVSHLASLEADAMAKLQQLSTSLNPGDYMKTARTLSAYQLESMVATKVIAKSTQAIEKLTSLQ